MGFITENFLLETETARYLFRQYASGQPILDYHCHLSPKDIAEDRRFNNLFEIWLEGDHYKWRAMRSNGVAERYCTGDVEPYEKFLAWASTVPHTLRNPLYHWTHLELLRYFDISELLDENSAQRVWTEANRRLKSDDLSARGILSNFRVRAVCTSDDPVDSLEYHEKIAASGFATCVLPSFRPDRAMDTTNPTAFIAWMNKLSQSSGMKISRFADFLKALESRHKYFHDHGCRLSDHGLDYCPAKKCDETQAAAIFDIARGGTAPSPLESEKFASFLMLFFGRLDVEKDWTKQLHLGAYRNANSRVLSSLGRDAGTDSIADWPQVSSLGTYLDRLDQTSGLPKMVLYNANPADNYAFATMLGNFQDGTQAGKIQFGSGWWFLDQKDAIEWQLNALSNCGLLSNFIGMLTDSRSFMSYPRHEYFRRVLCNLLGSEIEKGLLPDDESLVGSMISRVCYDNAERYLNLPALHTLEKPAVGVPKMQPAAKAVRNGDGVAVQQAKDL
jgi:glucuronate isomerase